MKRTKYNKMAVDFGTSNTIVAFWDDEKNDVVLHHIPDVTLPFYFHNGERTMEIPYVPSIIYYSDSRTRFIGYQVIEKSLERSHGTFRWIKAYIQNKRKMKYLLPDGVWIDYFQAGQDFLENLILYAIESGHVDPDSCEVAFSVPVEAFSHYTEWLSSVCMNIGIKRYRFIDEASASIFGYNASLNPGDIFFIFDFGGGTLDCSIVKIEGHIEDGQGCRILGKAGCHVGGRTIDIWLYRELLRRTSLYDIDVGQASGLIMLEVEKLKERLSREEKVEYNIFHPSSHIHLHGTLYRSEFEELLRKNSFYEDIIQTVERALKDARARGITEKDIREVLLIGGTSQIPSVIELVKKIFGEKVRTYRPYDAVARGACRFLTDSMEGLYDYIQHDYAIKYYDPLTKTHKFVPLVSKGTPYPVDITSRMLNIQAVWNGQRFFSIDIYEIAEKGIVATGKGEIVQNPQGEWIYERNPERMGTRYWLNEENPLIIEADPPAEKGVDRFTISFRVDRNKKLLINVWDVKRKTYLYKDYPVVKIK